VKRLIVGLAGLLILCLVTLLLFAEWAYGGRLKAQLDPQYLSIAQQFLNEPQELPTFIESIEPLPGSTINRNCTVCITVNSNVIGLSSVDVSSWTRIFVNNQRLSVAEYGVLLGGLMTPEMPPSIPTFCLTPELDLGLQLFEIRIGQSVLDLITVNEDHNYTWSYRVE
jgi:hypothetical protein